MLGARVRCDPGNLPHWYTRQCRWQGRLGRGKADKAGSDGIGDPKAAYKIQETSPATSFLRIRDR